MATLVKFRKDITPNFEGEITAVFPQLKHNKELYGNVQVTCYTHIGQHSACHIEWIKENTIPANEGEYLPLKQELESIGYNLKIVK